MQAIALSLTSQRRYNRVNYEGSVRYEVGREIGGHGAIRNVDQGGLCLQVDRPLSVGSRLVVEVDSPSRNGGSIELLGSVVWCKPAGSDDGYLAGVRVYMDEHDAMIALTELVCAGLKRAAGIRALRDRHFRYVEWGCCNDMACAPQRTSVWRRWIPRRAWDPSYAATLSF